MNQEASFFTRHTTPARNATESDPQSKQYPDLTEGGVERAKERAKTDILDIIKSAPQGAVIFIGGVSDQARTAQTAEIYGDALEEVIYAQKNNDDVEVVTKSDIDRLLQASNKKRAAEVAKIDERSLAQIDSDVAVAPDYEDVLTQITDYLKSEKPEKKIVITFPITLKGFSYGFHDRWATLEGKKTEYVGEILKKHNNDHTPAGIEWLATQGVFTTDDGRTIQGPNPTQVAKDYLESVRRLKEFAASHTERPIIIGGVGHQWDLDAVVTYLASGGEDVTLENFRRLVGENEKPLIGEAELFRLSVGEDNSTLDYRGKHVTIEQ